MGRKGHLFWNFSKQFSLLVEAPTCLGQFTQQDAQLRDATLAKAEAGSFEEGNKVIFSWLIDKKGIVLDALFAAFGDSVLIGCAEHLCEKSIGKPCQRALHITQHDLEMLITSEKEDLPGGVRRLICLVLQARDRLFSSLPSFAHNPEWETLSKEERLTLIREAIEQYILPHLQRDGGGIEILDLIDGNKVQIKFQGACVECIGSSGSTFAYIQQLLKVQVHPSLELNMPRSHRDNFA